MTTNKTMAELEELTTEDLEAEAERLQEKLFWKHENRRMLIGKILWLQAELERD